MKTSIITQVKRIATLTCFYTLFLFLNTSHACDWCNNEFFIELNSTRKGTLVADELLASIRAQHDFEALTVRAGMEGSESGSDATSVPNDFIDIIRRDNSMETRATSFVSQDTEPDKRVRITLAEGEVYLGNGVMYEGFTIDGSIPGPTIRVQEGDVVEFTIVNAGNIDHGASIHAAYTQTSKYLGAIAPRDSATVVFKANHPGVYMYHCAPGGHAIPMHVILGQYGMMVVEPRQKYRLEEELGRGPDVEIDITQHEIYKSGKDAVTGQGHPLYTTFNGKLFRYVEEPIMAKPGDYVRINFLNVGPNLLSTFHLVGIIWDYAYWQGNPENIYTGGQTITAGPSDSWTVEFRVPPDEGTYTMLTHAVGSASRGAIGLLIADNDAESTAYTSQQGPVYSEEQLAEFREKSLRVINSSAPGSASVDVPQKFGHETDEVLVQIIGNSFYPKVIDIKPGTTVTWVNEDVFSYMEGEFSGIHNAVATSGPDNFASPLMVHGETFSYTFEEFGDYEYICTPHPYMKGIITVSEPTELIAAGAGGGGAPAGMTVIALILAAFGTFLGFIAMILRSNKKPEN